MSKNATDNRSVNIGRQLVSPVRMKRKYLAKLLKILFLEIGIHLYIAEEYAHEYGSFDSLAKRLRKSEENLEKFKKIIKELKIINVIYL